jgi:hypothetical protein
VRSLTVDLHCHSFVMEVEQLVKDRPEKRAEPDLQRRFMGEPSAQYNSQTMLPNAFPKLTSVEARLKDMDAMGVDVQVGSSQVVVGTDYPFDMGSYEVRELVSAVPGLSEAERAAILGGNAARLIGPKT